MRDLPDSSVDCLLTDPPYGISFMGKKWDYNIPPVEVWRECLRVLKPGAFGLVACGTRTQHRMAVNLEDAGFEIRDIMAWVYGSGFPKSLNIKNKLTNMLDNDVVTVGLTDSEAATCHSQQEIQIAIDTYNGWGTALKPAMELWTLIRKPLSEKTVAQNVLKHGTGGINIDGCRVEIPKDDKGGFRPNSAGTQYVPTDSFGGGRITHQHPQGRFPANLIIDGSNEVVRLFPDTKSGTAIRGKLTVSHFGHKATPLEDLGYNDSGSAARFFYCAKSSKAERNWGCETNKNNHPTVKPIKLMQYLCRLITPKGGTVLDPFTGSGTTLVAAKQLGRNTIGIELERKYCDITIARLWPGIFKL